VPPEAGQAQIKTQEDFLGEILCIGGVPDHLEASEIYA
jgi:hypothetical protein